MFTNTSVKCAGGLSAKDARLLADELHTTPAFIESMKRRGPCSEFALWVKNLTGQAIRLTVPLGFLERQPTLTDEDYAELIDRNRESYCGHLADILAFNPPMPQPSLADSREPTASDRGTAAERQPSASARRANGAPPADIASADIQATEPTARRPSLPQAPNTPQDGPLHVAESIAPEAQPEGQEQPDPSQTTLLAKFESPSPAHERSKIRPLTTDREMGKGGRQHKYLQALAKELAEQQGLKATLEAPLTGGGQVDVLIERDGIVAAIEISVTTPVGHECENLAKCLAAGFPRIAVVLAKSKRAQASYRAALSEVVPQERRESVCYLAPEDLPTFIESLTAPPESQERIVKGYRVKSSFRQLSLEETKARQAVLAKLIAKSLSGNAS